MTNHPQLLVYTKKDNEDLGLSADIVLGARVLARTVSRIRYRPDIFYFSKGAENVDEIIATPSQKLSWEECCFQQAQHLLNLGKDRYYISYSGGIDSTAILVSILETWPKDALEKVTVLLSKTSVEENPTFFDRVAANFKMESSLQNMSALLLKSHSILVTGELGDQLFGSVALAQPWKDFGTRIFTDDYFDLAPGLMVGPRQRPIVTFERFAPIAGECPFPIRSTFDFFWWLNFTQKWQYVKYRFMQSEDWNLQAQYGEHVLHFYDSIAFQQWSLENHDLKIRNDWESYKFTIKEFIYKYTRDPEQLKLRKIQSLLKTFTFNEKRMAVTPEYKGVDSVGELREYVRR